jgi:RES domain-containing protein
MPASDLPRSYNLLEISVPDTVAIEKVEKIAGLPKVWINNQFATQQLGDSWLRRNSAALLEVPSALVPHTSNFLMNPGHPDAASITIVSIGQHPIDSRLLR